jgi:hypothetical protein
MNLIMNIAEITAIGATLVAALRIGYFFTAKSKGTAEPEATVTIQLPDGEMVERRMGVREAERLAHR